MTDGLKLNTSGFQQIGPDGLVTQHFPATPTVISLADVMEAARWIHDDLKQIHRAFATLHEMREKFVLMDGMYREQSAQHRALGMELAETVRVLQTSYELVARSVTEGLEAQQVRAELQSAEIARIELTLHHEMSAQFGQLRALVEYRWYKAFWARLKRYFKGESQ